VPRFVGAYSGSTLVSQVFDASVLPGWHSAVWNGRSGGAVVRDGEYGIVVQAHDAADNYTDPGLARVTVDTQRPRIVNLRADPSAFSPDGDGVDDTATISYRLSEWSRVYVVVAGQGLRFNLAAGEWQLSGDHSLVWDGLTAAGHPVPPGTYWVAALAIDPAFNMSFIPVTQVTVAPSWAPVTGP
jgi:hypothetical protein